MPPSWGGRGQGQGRDDHVPVARTPRGGSRNGIGRGQRRMTTIAPIATSISFAISGLNTRTQPFDTSRPAMFGLDVPWIAIRPPPGQSVITLENPERPSAKFPYGPVTS